MSKFDPAKLKALQQQKVQKVGGSRVNAKVAGNKTTISEDKKVTGMVTKMGGRVLTGCTEANFFMENGAVMHFPKPKVIGAIQSNTFAVSGKYQTRSLTELMPGILAQLGMDGIQRLQKMMPSEGEEAEEEAPALVDA
jgi:nascent polypeptide-associated complex subunit beta